VILQSYGFVPAAPPAGGGVLACIATGPGLKEEAQNGRPFHLHQAPAPALLQPLPPLTRAMKPTSSCMSVCFRALKEAAFEPSQIPRAEPYNLFLPFVYEVKDEEYGDSHVF